MNIVSILNILTFAVPLLWLAVILVYWFKNQSLDFKLIKYGILTVIALYILQGSYLTIATYNAWKLDPTSRYLLPPHQSISYFANYAYFHFWRKAVISILMGGIWAGFLFIIKKYSGGRILDKGDVVLGFFTAMVVGWPKIFAYLAIVFGLMALKGIANNFIFKDKNPIMAASSLALGALIAAGFSDFFMKIPFFDNLKL